MATTKAAHTPGPWGIYQAKDGDFGIQAGSTFIAHLYEKNQSLLRGTGPKNPEADARLIAAAPELLTAASLAYEILGKHRLASMDQNPKGIMDVLGSAITKATDET